MIETLVSPPKIVADFIGYQQDGIPVGVKPEPLLPAGNDPPIISIATGEFSEPEGPVRSDDVAPDSAQEY